MNRGLGKLHTGGGGPNNKRLKLTKTFFLVNAPFLAVQLQTPYFKSKGTSLTKA
jgi:hypothetical protein